MGVPVPLIKPDRCRLPTPLLVTLTAGLLFLLATIGVNKASAQSPLQDSAEATRALFEAVRQNDLPAVQAGITAGADINAVNSWGLTPADVAVDKGHFDIAHFLLSLRTFKPADSEKVGQKLAPQSSGRWGPVVTTNTASPPPPPVPVAPVASGPIQPEEAPAPPPTWPSNKPNPFDPGYVAPDSTLPVIGDVHGPKNPPLKAQALDVEAPAAPSEDAPPPKGFLNKVTNIFKSAPARPKPEPVIQQAETPPPEKVEAPEPIPALKAEESEKAAPSKTFIGKMEEFFASDKAKTPPSKPEMPAEPPVEELPKPEDAIAAAPEKTEGAAPSKGFLDKMSNFFNSGQAKAPPEKPVGLKAETEPLPRPAEKPTEATVSEESNIQAEAPRKPEDVLAAAAAPLPSPGAEPEETAPTKGFLKKMTDFFRPDESRDKPAIAEDVPTRPETTPKTPDAAEAPEAAPTKTPPEAPAGSAKPAEPAGLLGKLNNLFAPPKPRHQTTEERQTAPPQESAAEGKEETDGKESASEKKDWAVKGVETANVSTPLPVKPPPAHIPKNFLDNVELTLGQSVKLGSPLVLPKGYEGGGKPCVEKKGGTVAFCIKPVDWPDEIEPLVLVGTVMYSGLKSIVRYDEGKASRFHTLFPAESFEGIVAYHTRRFGPPTESLDRSIAPLAAQRRNNPTVMWQSVNPVTKQVTTLEIRKFDDTRGGFPDIERGAVMLYNQWSSPIFPQLSTVELMLLRPHEVM